MRRWYFMAPKFIITGYIDTALKYAVYDKLEDGSFSGRIPKCKGVVAFAKTLKACEEELHSTLEDWILLGFRLGHKLPVIDNIDINKKPLKKLQYESLVTV